MNMDHTDDHSNNQNLRTCISENTMNTLFDMRTTNILCDATITMSDGIVYNVHRNILGSCSEYFRCVNLKDFCFFFF